MLSSACGRVARFAGPLVLTLVSAGTFPALAAADSIDGGPCVTAEFTPYEETLPANSPGILVSQTTPVTIERLVDEVWEPVDVTVVSLDRPYYRDARHPGEQLLAIADLVEGQQLRARTECGREQRYTVTPPLDAPAGVSLTVRTERDPIRDGTDRFHAVLRVEPEGVLTDHAFIWRAYITVDGEPNVTTGPRIVFPDPAYRLPLACEGAEGWAPGPHEIRYEMGPAGAEPTAVFAGTFDLTCPGGVDADTLSDDGCAAAASGRSAAGSLGLVAAVLLGRRRRSRVRRSGSYALR